jgi:hypothetical protein
MIRHLPIVECTLLVALPLFFSCTSHSDRPIPDAGDHDALEGDPDALNATEGASPHPFYPALDLATLPLFETEHFTYEPPALPTVSGEPIVVHDLHELRTACGTGNPFDPPAESTNREILVESDLFGQGAAILNGSHCDISFAPDVRVDALYVHGSHLRFRGGTFGHFHASEREDIPVHDIILDGVVINTGIIPNEERAHCAMGFTDVNRFVIVNSLIRAASRTFEDGSIDGCGFLVSRSHDVMFAHTNIATGEQATRNGWFARIEAGSNWLFIDLNVKVFQHKMMRISNDGQEAVDGPTFDYLVIRGGSWMHANTAETVLNYGGGEIDHIYVEDVSFYLNRTTGDWPVVTFGDYSNGPDGTYTHRWWATNLHWYARDETVVSDDLLASREAGADPGEDLQYRLGSPTYTYQEDGPIQFADWQPIAGFEDPDPENLPLQ